MVGLKRIVKGGKNMRLTKKIFATVVVMTMIFALLSSHLNAATGYQGYAIYRDGVFFNTTWHAGIMDEPYCDTYIYPVVHHPGSGYVKWDSWENFLDGNNFKGVYRPNSSPSSSTRDLFVAMGRKLKDEQISYNLAYQVYYDTGSSGTWVDPSEISSMRCDGVVEYTFEWYGYRVYGSDTYWDVTKNSFLGRNHHSGTAVTPKSQAEDCLTLVTSSVPED